MPTTKSPVRLILESKLPHSHYISFISNKAVADGAISYNIDHLVTTRVAKLTYGIHCTWMFDSSQSDHVSRKDTLFRELDGSWRLPNAFSSILKKVILSSWLKHNKSLTSFREPRFLNSKNFGIASFNWENLQLTVLAFVLPWLFTGECSMLHAGRTLNPVNISKAGIWHLTISFHSCFYAELSNPCRYICGRCCTPSKEISWGKNLLSHRLWCDLVIWPYWAKGTNQLVRKCLYFPVLNLYDHWPIEKYIGCRKEV